MLIFNKTANEVEASETAIRDSLLRPVCNNGFGPNALLQGCQKQLDQGLVH